MSGGSGCRLNAFTLSYIKQQQERDCEEMEVAEAFSEQEQDIDDYCGEQDGMQYAQEDEIDPFQQLDSLYREEQPELNDFQITSVPSIDDQDDNDYEKMSAGSIINTKIFDINTSASISNLKYDAETYRVLETAFSPGVTADLPQLRKSIAEKSNFEIREVTRLMNKKVRDMHLQFKRSYEIKQTCVVYHGTGNADLISEVGFRGAASQRAKFGRGIYSSPNVFHAISYGQLTAEGYLTFLVVELHLGPIALGSEDQVFHRVLFRP